MHSTLLKEFFWSKASATNAGIRLQRKHGYGFCVNYVMRADGRHDWLLVVSASAPA